VSVRALVPAALMLGLGLSCDTSTGPADPGDASYAVEYTPGRLVSVTPSCDRFVTHAVLSLGQRNRGFDLSTNLYDDCSRTEGGFTFWEVLIIGHYSITDTLLAFTPESGATPAFTGTFDATHVRLTLPARSDSLAVTPITLELGPRTPF
jgi:hypothetical protein